MLFLVTGRHEERGTKRKVKHNLFNPDHINYVCMYHPHPDLDHVVIIVLYGPVQPASGPGETAASYLTRNDFLSSRSRKTTSTQKPRRQENRSDRLGGAKRRADG